MPIAHTWQPGYLFVHPISPPNIFAKGTHASQAESERGRDSLDHASGSNIKHRDCCNKNHHCKTKAETLWRYKPLWLLSLSCASPPVCAVVWCCRFFVVSPKKSVPWGSPSKTNLATVSQRFQRNVNVCKCGKNMHGCTVCMRLYYLSRAVDCITSVHLCKCWRSTLKAKDCALNCSGWWAI